MTESLQNVKDVARVRELLLKEQCCLDTLTGLPIPDKQAVLDHNHKTQYVRGVLHRQTNAVLGKIENLWVRYLSYWYNGTLSEFLRKAADYIERKDDHRFVHPAWKKRVTVDFNKLTASDQSKILAEFNLKGNNATERKKQFGALLKSKKVTFSQISKLLKEL